MKVKGGGGRTSWEEAMTAAADVVVQTTTTTNHPIAASFAPLQHQPYSVSQPKAQPQSLHQPLEQGHQELTELEEADDGDVDGEGSGEGGFEGSGEAAVADGGDDGVVEDDENRERTKLADGFYEIEAIRRKRVRKGQLQYLIKWRGWPETANTWEPLDNLQSIADVIEAFEESLLTGKNRKRKRKSGTPHSQPKKRQQRSTVHSYDVTDAEISMSDKSLSSAALNCSSLGDLTSPQQPKGHDRENNGHVNNIDPIDKIAAENWLSNAFQQIGKKREGNEHDPKLSELKETFPTNILNLDRISGHLQEAKAVEVNGPTNGFSMNDCAEPVQNNRSTGAKRRKSGSVKRFKQETQLSELGGARSAATRVSVRCGSRVNHSEAENHDYAGENSCRRNKIDESKRATLITKIIKPIGYSSSVSNGIQDVLVTFAAMRSDGAEVSVTNNFLKVYSRRMRPKLELHRLCRSAVQSWNLVVAGERVPSRMFISFQSPILAT